MGNSTGLPGGFYHLRLREFGKARKSVTLEFGGPREIGDTNPIQENWDRVTEFRGLCHQIPGGSRHRFP